MNVNNMETVLKSAACSEHEEDQSVQKVFRPQETTDHPCDITLLAEDGKQFRAHREILSEASPFFEKLLQSNMKESNEGVIRLEMFTESVLAAALEFIYKGNVQFSTQEVAEGAIIIAEYLMIPNLKVLAEKAFESLQTLDDLNCIPTYYFAQRFQCKGIAKKAKSFIYAHFTCIAGTEVFLNLPSKEVEMWISSDKINVHAEEDVFKVILAWIDHDKSNRRKYFSELFRHVRLIHISRDVLGKDVVTNDLVTATGGLDAGKDAMKICDAKDFDNLPVAPRKSLQTPVIVACSEKHSLCYFPREDKWCRLGESVTSGKRNQIVCPFSHGKLYSVRPSFFMTGVPDSARPAEIRQYNLFSNTQSQLPFNAEGLLKQIAHGKNGEIYALVLKRCPNRRRHREGDFCKSCENRMLDVSLITKYIPESNSWEEVVSFVMGSRERICFVANRNFIYLIGGGQTQKRYEGCFIEVTLLKDVDRYNLSRNTWEKVADMQRERMSACGTATHAKTFVAGGDEGKTCEVYDEGTNEWQCIGSLKKGGHLCCSMVCCDGQLYVLGGYCANSSEGTTVQCYDPEKNEWKEKTKLPFDQYPESEYCFVSACSMGIFKKFLPNV